MILRIQPPGSKASVFDFGENKDSAVRHEMIKCAYIYDALGESFEDSEIISCFFETKLISFTFSVTNLFYTQSIFSNEDL